MSLAKIEAALISAYKAVALDLPTSYESRTFTPPNNAVWASVRNVPSDNEARTLGDDGENLMVGFFQIDITIPEQAGTAAANSRVDALLRYFKPGLSIVYHGQAVRIRKSVPSQLRRADTGAGWTKTVSVYWRAWVKRDEDVEGPVIVPDPGGNDWPNFSVGFENQLN